MKLTLGEIEEITNGRVTSDTDKNSIAKSVFTDSREADNFKYGLFAAIKGEHADGHNFVSEVIENGCFALIDDSRYFIKNTILTSDTRDALQTLAECYRTQKLCDTKIIAVTGSVGKTSTKDMVALALGSELKTSKTQGNKNSQTGLPLSILETEQKTEAAVIELGMSEPGEITKLSKISKPDIAIITNIGYSHIEALGSRENICAEKLAAADYMPKCGILILNGDEPLLKKNNRYSQRKIYCSVKSKENDCYAEDITELNGETSFTANILGEKTPVLLKTVGIHNVSNALFALTAASLLGVNLKKAAESLQNYASTGLRQKIYTKNGYTIIADCYNASPESMSAALSVLGKCKGRKIAVLGDMLELGSFAPSLHEKVGESVLANHVNILITFGSFAKHIAKPVIGKINVYSFNDGEYDKAAELLKSILMPEDTVLYKASNRMKLQNIIKNV